MMNKAERQQYINDVLAGENGQEARMERMDAKLIEEVTPRLERILDGQREGADGMWRYPASENV